MFNWENMTKYVPLSENGIFRDKTDEHFYFNGSGKENSPEVYIHTIKKTKNGGNSYHCDFPAADVKATWKMT